MQQWISEWVARALGQLHPVVWGLQRHIPLADTYTEILWQMIQLGLKQQFNMVSSDKYWIRGRMAGTKLNFPPDNSETRNIDGFIRILGTKSYGMIKF